MLNEGHCGYVAIIGRPNVGKSTLLNHLLGQKLCITSRKPQTTRHRILGIKTTGKNQIIYVDTPGIHQRKHNAMNRYLNRAATTSIEGVEVIVWVVESLHWTEEDSHVLKALAHSTIPVVLCINKVDKLERHVEKLQDKMEIMLDKDEEIMQQHKDLFKALENNQPSTGYSYN